MTRLEKLTELTPDGVAAMTRLRGKMLNTNNDLTPAPTPEKLKGKSCSLLKKCIMEQENESLMCSTSQRCNMTLSLVGGKMDRSLTHSGSDGAQCKLLKILWLL